MSDFADNSELEIFRDNDPYTIEEEDEPVNKPLVLYIKEGFLDD